MSALGAPGTSGLGWAALGSRSSLALDHVVGDDPEQGPQLPVQLGTHPVDDELALLWSEVGWEVLDGLKEVICHDAAVLDSFRRDQLDQRSRVVADHLDRCPRIGGAIISQVL